MSTGLSSPQKDGLIQIGVLNTGFLGRYAGPSGLGWAEREAAGAGGELGEGARSRHFHVRLQSAGPGPGCPLPTCVLGRMQT